MSNQTRVGASDSISPELLPAGAEFYLPNPEANRELRKQTPAGKLAYCASKASVSNRNKWKDFTQLLTSIKKKKKAASVSGTDAGLLFITARETAALRANTDIHRHGVQFSIPRPSGLKAARTEEEKGKDPPNT